MTDPAEYAPHRSIRIPRLLRLVRGVDAVVAVLADGPAARRHLVVHSGARSATGYGSELAARAAGGGAVVTECVIERNDAPAVDRVAAAIDAAAPDAVVGVGGGRVVDVVKLAAAGRSVDVVIVPTQLASDAVCSPVAVVLDRAGNRESVGARMPSAVIVDLDVADRAPRTTWLAGLGDLVSNLSAVRDWRSAHEDRGEEFDDFACLTSEAAALSVIEDDADLGDPDYRQKLIRGLILSGIAMEMAGSSRPASGSEHLISHALDRTLERPRSHGLQVAVGSIAAGILRGDDLGRLVGFFRRVGLPVVPGDLGIDLEAFIDAVRLGPSTRPGRSTCLDAVVEADLVRLRATLATLASGPA